MKEQLMPEPLGEKSPRLSFGNPASLHKDQLNRPNQSRSEYIYLNLSDIDIQSVASKFVQASEEEK